MRIKYNIKNSAIITKEQGKFTIIKAYHYNTQILALCYNRELDKCDIRLDISYCNKFTKTDYRVIQSALEELCRYMLVSRISNIYYNIKHCVNNHKNIFDSEFDIVII